METRGRPLGSLSAGQRCMGPPSSNILSFRLADLPHAHFITYGTGPGTVVVQQMQAAHSSTATCEPQPPMVLELRVPRDVGAFTAAGSQGGATFVPAEPVSRVAWSEADGECLLAAAAGTHVAVFSLQRYIMRLLGESEGSLGVLPSPAPLVHSARHSVPLAALDFTQSGDGFLIADAAGGIAMYAIPQHHSRPAGAAPDAASSSWDATTEFAGGIGAETKASFRGVLEQAWAGRGSTVTSPQTLISAGVHCWAPAATGQPGGSNVTVWWPPSPPASAPKPPEGSSAAATDAPSAEAKPAAKGAEFSSETLRIMGRLGPGDGGSAPSGSAAKANGASSAPTKAAAEGGDREPRSWVMAEQLRHPVGVVGVQWSPGSLQKGHHDEGDDPTALLPASQPALLTVTADGILRIWVEVTLAPSVGSNPLHVSKPGLPGLPGGSHFCVTLVIQPPNGVWGTGSPRGLRASWGAPEGGAFPVTGAQIRAAKVLWITAVAEIEGEAPQEKLLLWAVDGLTGVVLGGLPTGAARGSASRIPRAVLWGQHVGQLTWAGQDAAATAGISVTVSLDAEAPALHVFESVSSPEKGVGKIRHYRIATVEDEPLSPSAPPTPGLRSGAAARQLPLHDAAAYELLGHAAPIATLAAHLSAPLAITLDSQGSGLLWSTDVLAPVARLPCPEGQRLTAAAWLTWHGQPGSAGTSLAYVSATGSTLQLFGLDRRKSGDEPQLLFSVGLPLKGCAVPSLHSLPAVSGSRVAGLLTTGHSKRAQTSMPGQSSPEQVLGVWEADNGGASKEPAARLKFLGCQAVPGEPAVSLAAVAGSGFNLILGCECGILQLIALKDGANGQIELLSVSSFGEGAIGAYTALGASAGGGLIAAFCKSQAGNHHNRLHIWEGRSGLDYILAADLAWQDDVSDLQWLDTLSPVPAIAVGGSDRGVQILARGHDGRWGVAAELDSISLPMPLLAHTPTASLLAASGNQMCILEEHISFPVAAGAVPEKKPLARELLEASGGRAEWHPDVLSQLLRHGRLEAAAQAIRALIAEPPQEGKILGQMRGPRLSFADVLDPSLLNWAAAVAATPPANVTQLSPNSPPGEPPQSSSQHYPPASDSAALSDGSSSVPPGTGGAAGQGGTDLFTFNPAVFGEPSAAEQPGAEQPGGRPVADPFAFDMGAFGEEAAQQPPSAVAADPFSFDPAAFGQPSASSAQPEDPYAFDMSAFGGDSHDQPGKTAATSKDPLAGDLSTLKKQPAARAQLPTDPYAFDMGAFDAEEAPGPPGQPAIAAAAPHDPYAFDMGAFGMGAASAPQEQPGSNPPAAQDPYAFDMGAFGRESAPGGEDQPGESSAAAHDPYAFDMGVFGMESAPGEEVRRRNETGKGERVSDLQPGKPPRQAASQPWAAASHRSGAGKELNKGLLPKPEKAIFRPLSEAELTLVRRALGLGPREEAGSSRSDKEEEPESERVYGVFGKGPAAANLAAKVVSLAEMLSRGAAGKLVEAVALDAAGQKLLTSTQLAVVKRGETVHPEASTSGRGAGGEASRQLPWAQERAGLLEGLGMDAVLWGLISESHQVLLSTCTDVVPADASGDATPVQPKIDFTSRGVKTLDLGFGASRVGGPMAGRDSPKSWDVLRKMGAGFWLQDQAAVKVQAEALAKARFAETKDPADCALFYAALGKHVLLKGLFKSANKAKQADFLSRDFRQPKNQEAACKNAFVLLGQHRHELAAAFFVLGGSYKDAVGVCAHEMGDPQLALFLCRILEGSLGPLQQHLLAQDLLPEAKEAGDLYAVAVCEWLLGNKPAALVSVLSSSPPDSSASAKQQQAVRRLGHGGSDNLALLRLISATVPGSAEKLSREADRVAHLALQSSKAHEVEGMPGLALEAAGIAEVLGKVPLASWKSRLAASALVRLLKPATASASHQTASTGVISAKSATSGRGWETAARQELEVLRKLGSKVEEAEVLGVLAALQGKLWPLKAVTAGRVEPEAPSEASSRATSTRRSFHLQGHHSGGLESGKIFGDGYELLRIEGDKVHDVCCCNSDAGDWENPNADWRPFVAATGRHGLVEGELVPPKGLSTDDIMSSATSESSHKGSTFTALLSDMLDAMRWPPDPWTMVAPLPGATVGAAGPTAREPAVALSNSPSHRANHVATATLAAHPFRPLYLSGSATGEIYLWQFGGKGAKAGYTPLPASSHAPPSSPASLFSSSARSWNPSPGVPFSHWGQPQSVRFSECGERFAAIGEGGVVAAWRLDAPRLASSDTGALGRADWVHQGLSKRGVDVVYVGGGTSLLAVGGFCTLGGNIVIWDTLAPLTAPPVARLSHHSSMVTSLQALPGGRVLMSADETGMLAAVDLRMVGAGENRKALLWQARNPTGGVTCMTVGVRPSNGHAVLVSGSRSGLINVWSADRGHMLQSMAADPVGDRQAARSKGRGFFSDALKVGKPPNGGPVTGVVVCPEGLVSSSLQGSVQLHPLQ